jgi:hypothetical protein
MELSFPAYSKIENMVLIVGSKIYGCTVFYPGSRNEYPASFNQYSVSPFLWLDQRQIL